MFCRSHIWGCEEIFIYSKYIRKETKLCHLREHIFVNFNTEEVITFSVVGRALLASVYFYVSFLREKGNISRKLVLCIIRN